MKITVMCKPDHLLRKPGPKRVRLVDTDEQIKAGLAGKPVKVVRRSSADYFTDQPEEVEFTPWVERMVRKGALLQVTASKPRAASTPMSEKPMPLSE